MQVEFSRGASAKWVGPVVGNVQGPGVEMPGTGIPHISMALVCFLCLDSVDDHLKHLHGTSAFGKIFVSLIDTH